jgi:activator of 2-hydroxyglutaryl-CoA dehydratase
MSEPEAVEYALRAEFEKTQFPEVVVSCGGEMQLVYVMDQGGGIKSVQSGNKCAAGTGEFFMQQIRRMGLTTEQTNEMVQHGIPYHIAGRCSVFCKSDCTHALNKGEPIENVVTGLCAMMADKIYELIKELHPTRIALIGGGSFNKGMIRILKHYYPTLCIPDNAAVFEAYGAALWAQKHSCIP